MTIIGTTLSSSPLLLDDIRQIDKYSTMEWHLSYFFFPHHFFPLRLASISIVVSSEWIIDYSIRFDDFYFHFSCQLAISVPYRTNDEHCNVCANDKTRRKCACVCDDGCIGRYWSKRSLKTWRLWNRYVFHVKFYDWLMECQTLMRMQIEGRFRCVEWLCHRWEYRWFSHRNLQTDQSVLRQSNVFGLLTFPLTFNRPFPTVFFLHRFTQPFSPENRKLPIKKRKNWQKKPNRNCIENN